MGKLTNALIKELLTKKLESINDQLVTATDEKIINELKEEKIITEKQLEELNKRG